MLPGLLLCAVHTLAAAGDLMDWRAAQRADGGLHPPPGWDLPGAPTGVDALLEAPWTLSDEETPPDAGSGPVDAGVNDAAEPPEEDRYRVRGVAVRVDRPREGEEEMLRAFTGVAVNDVVSRRDVRGLETRLMGLGVFRSVACTAVVVEPGAVQVVCGVATAQVIARIRVEGLPITVLRREIDRYIFLRPGQRLEAGGPASTDRLARQRQRLEKFLEREGLFGTVSVDTAPMGEDGREVELLVRLGQMTTRKVGKVHVEGVPRMAVGELVGVVRGYPLEVFRPGRTQERLAETEARWRRRGHPEARVSMTWKLNRKTADVTVKVRLGPYVRIQVENLTSESTDDLADQLTLVENGSTDDAECDASAAAIQAWLQGKGHYDANVRWERSEGRLTFHVHSAQSGHLESVMVTGVPGLDGDLVRRQAGLALGPRGVLLAQSHPPLLAQPLVAGGNGVFTRMDLEDDVHRLESYLRRNGWPEAVVTPRVHATASGQQLTVEFRVEAGQRYVVADVRFEPRTTQPAAALRKAAGVHAGSPFDPNALDEYTANVLEYYTRHGFLRADVRTLIDFDVQGRAVLNFHVTEGPRSRLAGILLEGNQRTQEAVIRREMALRAGDPVDPVAVDDALARLRRSGVFRRVSSRWVGLNEAWRDVWLVVMLEERPVRTLDGAVGVSTAEYLTLSTEARDRNMFGGMVEGALVGQLGPLVGLALAAPYLGINTDVPQPIQNVLGSQLGMRSRSRVDALFRVPRVLGTRLNLLASANAELRDRPIPAATQGASVLELETWRLGGLDVPVPFSPPGLREYDQERYGQVLARVGGEFPWTSAFTTGAAYGYEAFIRQVTPSPNEKWDPGTPTLAGWLETTAALNLLDNPFDPKRGVLLNTRVKVGSRLLLGQGEFLVVGGQAAAYYTWRRLTFAASVRGTAVVVDGAAGNKRVVPRRDVGIAGGDRSVRGYDEDAIRVRTRTLRSGTNPSDARSVVNEPGLYSWIANAEVRFLALRDVGPGDIQLATFVDAAQVTDTWALWALDREKRPTEVGVGVGAGIRYVTPVGPVSLDYGVNALDLPKGRLHLLFGYTF